MPQARMKSTNLSHLLWTAILIGVHLNVGRVFAFGPPLFFPNGLQRRINRSAYPMAATRAGTNTEQDPLEQIRSMRVKELKAELSSLSISTADVFEKDELVSRLYQARKNGATSKKETTTTSDCVRVPLFFASMDVGMRVAAVNRGGMTIQPSAQPYAAIQIELEGGYKSTLLLDTACSGLVLRPSVVRNHNLPTYNTPVTMTAAGGSASNTGLTQLNRFKLGKNTYGPVPAAVQDIGALPSSLDGIMGLSFLNQVLYDP